MMEIQKDQFNGLLLLAAFLLTTGFSQAQVSENYSDTDDPLQSARTSNVQISDLEKKVVASLEKIEKLVSEYKLDDWRAQDLVLKTYKDELIPEMKDLAEDLLRRKAEFDKNFTLYKSVVQKAPASFDKASKHYKDLADKEEDLFFKEQYLDMSNIATKWGENMEGRKKSLDKIYAEVEAKTKFVERSVQYLDQLEAFLEIYPDSEKGAEVEEYLKKINKYMDNFERAIKAFKTLSETLDKPEAPTPQPVPQAASIQPVKQHIPVQTASFQRSRPVVQKPMLYAGGRKYVSRPKAKIVEFDTIRRSTSEFGRVAIVGDEYTDGVMCQVNCVSRPSVEKGDQVSVFRNNRYLGTMKVLGVHGVEVVGVCHRFNPLLGDTIKG